MHTSQLQEKMGEYDWALEVIVDGIDDDEST